MKDFYCKGISHICTPPPILSTEKTILPSHPLEIRDLNEGVSSRKMDRSQLMCFFFFLTLYELTPPSQLGLTWDIRVMKLKGKHWACLSYFQCLGCHQPKFLDWTHDLFRGSKLQANFTNMFLILYILKSLCIEGWERAVLHIGCVCGATAVVPAVL